MALFVFAQSVHAQPTNKTVIKITGTKFPFDIMQQWINAYTKIHPAVQFELSKNISPDSAELMIAAHAFKSGELKEDQAIVAVNRYAQLPVVNISRTDLHALQQKGFTQHDLNNIYFNADDKSTNAFAVYKRNKNVCATRSFAENVTGSQQDIKGTLVNGDDKALLAAVKNDVNGISYNNLGFIYNIETRKPADSIALIPMDLNANGRIDDNEKVYTTLDELLDFLSENTAAAIPQENVNIVFSKKNISKPAIDFLQWIITEGQQYNRHYGFLSLDKAVVLQQQHLLSMYESNAKK